MALNDLRDGLGAPVRVLEEGAYQVLDLIRLVIGRQRAGAIAPEFGKLLERGVHHGLQLLQLLPAAHLQHLMLILVQQRPLLQHHVDQVAQLAGHRRRNVA